ncbi:hypothetical protein HGP14_18480 [Rhizobium sp. P32RR-XVIII]|uniref:hypothetical protein n=1 Tax=Rhizobium sp. P32RR-XVIII TaxID=2726738 RepID=UPI001456CB17|nr:hypothetical protein [Rhizobium sp. P32RR-XVIII]NLS05336.1 hypothetical protein [Rhizobium sp. P32RR-XVIII]
MRDPFKNPFPASDEARHSIWEMLVHRDIDAFLAADWSKVDDDFIEEGFIGIDGRREANPDHWRLNFPTLAAYRDEWLRQAQDFQRQTFAEDPRTAIFTATTLEDIEINGDVALVRKKFDGSILRADGERDRCRKHDGRWRIAGFTGYLPNPMG